MLVTFTEIAHEPAAAMVPPLRLTLPAPIVAVNVPLQLLLPAGVPATTTLVGKVSENATPVRPSVLFGLVIEKPRVEIPPTGMLAGEKPLLIVGGLATVSVAVLLVVPVPPLVELTALVVLLTMPAVWPVTLREIVQELLMPIEPPRRESAVLVEVAPVKVPPQVLTRLGVAATCRPPVSVSLKATPVSPTVLAEGVGRGQVRVVVPPTPILVAPNALLIVGGATTITVLVHELLVSLNSIMSLLGSTAQTPPVGLT